MREFGTRRMRRERLSEENRHQLRQLVRNTRLTTEETNREFRACQLTLLALLDVLSDFPAGADKSSSRLRLRKLVADSIGDCLNVDQTSNEFGACRESIFILLHAYEVAPSNPEASFTAWAYRRAKRDTEVDDFVNDWLRDSQSFEPSTLAELTSHITMRGAARDRVDAARRAWRSYSSWKQRSEANERRADMGD